MSAAEAVFTDFLSRLANDSLSLDPLSASRLERLEGCMLRIEARMPTDVSNKISTLKVEDGHLAFYPHPWPEPSVIVKGNLVDLGAWFLSPGNAANLTIDGDETVLQQFIDVFRGFAPDLAKPLTNVFGSEVAENLLGAAELAFAALRSAVEGAGSAIKENAGARYADEARLNTLLDGIDDVRMRVDRVAARVRAEETRRRAQ